MTTELDMNGAYREALREAERELAGMEERRASLLATVAGLKRLLGSSGQLPLGNLGAVERPSANGRHARVTLAIPPGFFEGKTPTQAYRELVRRWPGEYTGAQIADAFEAGGMSGKSRTQLLQSIHSVLKRERDKQKKEAPMPEVREEL